MKKILIIGGAGFIGYHLTKKLSEDPHHDITIVDNFFRGKRDGDLRALISENKIKVVEADLTKQESFAQLDNAYHQIYMLASVVGVDYTTSIPHEIIRINTALIYNTLEWLRTITCDRVLFTSTSECYAGTIEAFDYDIPTPETVPLCISDIAHPRFTYAVTKMLGESGFHQYAKAYGFELIVVRYHNVYGPRMGFKHVIPHLAQRFAKGENPFKVYGHDQTRAFCFISDGVKGTILAMEKGRSGETYHIGTQEEITIENLIRYVGSLYHFNGDYENAPTYPGSVRRRCPDISKATGELGFTPEVSWKDGVRQTIKWYREYLDTGKIVYE